MMTTRNDDGPARRGRPRAWTVGVALLAILALGGLGGPDPGQAHHAAAHATGGLGGPPASAAQGLTEALVRLNTQYQLADGGNQGRLLGQLLQVAAARRQLLEALVESDPGEVLRVALPPTIAASLPGPVQRYVEEEVEVEGTLEVLHEDRDDGRDRYLHFLDTPAGERLALHFAGEAPELPTGTGVRVRGVRVGGTLAAPGGNGGGTTSSSGSVTTVSTIAPNTFGDQKTLVMLVNFQDKATQPYTPSQAADVVFRTTSDFYQENSYGQTGLSGDVAGWFTIALSYTVCDHHKLASLANSAASEAGVDLSAYTRYIYGFPKNACSWWGMGTVGGKPSRAWINGSFTLRVVGHELGHNFGDYHSRSLACNGSTCTSSEYGDGWDILGAAASGHLNAFQKERLGWLNYGSSPPITTAEADGIYELDPYETGSGPKALKILKATDPSTGKRTWYYVEFRGKQGFDASLASAVLVHTGSESSAREIYLWDLQPTTSTTDWTLDPYQVYNDPNAGVTLATLAAGVGGAAVQVTFGPLPCVPAPPEQTITPSQTQWLSPGDTATYTVTLTNKDSSSCDASVFLLEADAPDGWVAAFEPPALVLAPGATGSAALTVAPAVDASDGFYTVPVMAVDDTVTATTSVTIALVSKLDVRVSTDNTRYARNSWIYVTAFVGWTDPDTGQTAGVAGAAVTLTVRTPSGGVYATASGSTDASGNFAYRFRTKPKDESGTWRIDAAGTKGGLSGSSSTTFTLQ
jgi:hypothetical protein